MQIAYHKVAAGECVLFLLCSLLFIYFPGHEPASWLATGQQPSARCAGCSEAYAQ